MADERDLPFYGDFDYLKVQDFSRDVDNLDDNYQYTYSLASCVIPSSVKIQYTDNATFTLSLSAIDDGSGGFKALHEGSLILAGSQTFVIQNYTRKTAGTNTAEITATQILNAYSERIYQPRKWSYQKAGEAITYTNVDELVDWFTNGINMMGFHFKLGGYFPRRQIKNVGPWTLKQFMTQITTTWPGTIIFGWGYNIYIYGYAKNRDKDGNLINIRDYDTGIRFNTLVDASDVSVSYDMSKMCNAVEVKSALHSVQVGDGSSETAEVFQNQPYWPDFLAVSQESINKYGTYYSTEPLTDFTQKDAAEAAAREKMVLQPVLKVSATIKHPGRTEVWPIPGYKYTIGIPQDHEVHHVKLCGFTWCPFDSSKGTQLELASVDPGIVANLRQTIIHDAEMSPSLTSFKALSGGESSDGDAGDDDSVDTDGDTDRPDDYGDGTSDGSGSKDDSTQPTNPGFKAYLGIGDRKGNAYVTPFGNVVIKNGADSYWALRASDQDTITSLRDGKFNDKDKNPWKNWRTMIRAQSSGTGMMNSHGNQHYYKDTDLYAGHNVFFDTGMWSTTADAITFRTGITDDDYYKDGQLKHYFKDDKGHEFYREGHKNKNGQTPYGIHHYRDASKKNPGKLAQLQAGSVLAHDFGHYSLLSLKENVRPLDKEHALNTILKTDIGLYNFKNDVHNEEEASVVIDDIHDDPKWSTPKELLTEDGKHANDTKTLGYLVKSVQALQDQINDLKAENKDLKKQLKNKDSQNN